MVTQVRIQPHGFCVGYPRTPWRVVFVEDAHGKFLFRLSSHDFKFEPRDRHRYLTHDEANRAALCFLELLKKLERSRMRLGILAEIGILKFPQETYHTHKLWLLVDRNRYSWEILRVDGCCLRSQRWYKQRSTALFKAKAYIEREQAMSQIKEVVGWV